jgi:predicted transcriptional regulator
MKTANIGRSMKEAQHITRISTATVAQRLGETRQSVYYTRRNASASIHKVQKLAEIFGMSIDEFVNLGDVDA